jgi:hypothetical protein
LVSGEDGIIGSSMIDTAHQKLFGGDLIEKNKLGAWHVACVGRKI